MFLSANTTEWNCVVETVNNVECRSLEWQARAIICIWKATGFLFENNSKATKV